MTGKFRNRRSQFDKRLTSLVTALALCAVAPQTQARPKLTPPAPISDVYSDADMRLHLATMPGIEAPCADEECELNHAFDTQVRNLGARIAAAAYDAHPDLIKRIPRFEFSIAEKKDPGITSNASGKVVMLRGTQHIGLNDEALSFVIAREMGHIISQHHEENATTRILLSVAAGVLFPVLNLFGNTATVAQATSSATTVSSTTLATTAASTATSYLGSKLVLNSLKPEQLNEADQVALDLMRRMGWSHRDLALALENSAEFEPSNAWSDEFRYSAAQVRALETVAEEGEALPEITYSNVSPGTMDDDSAEPVDEAMRDSEGNPIPPLQEAVANIEEESPAPIAIAPVPEPARPTSDATPQGVAQANASEPAVTPGTKHQQRRPARVNGKPATHKLKIGKGAKRGKSASAGKLTAGKKPVRAGKSPTAKGSITRKSGKAPKPAKLARKPAR